jgi:hypothetical protein
VDRGHQGVEDPDLVTSFQQQIYCMGADKACSTGNQCFHGLSLTIFPPLLLTWIEPFYLL